MNKKGMEITLTTVIVAILIILVLIVVATFFLTGSSRLFDAVNRIFYGTTAGFDKELALQTCEQRCERAKDLSLESRPNSAYCTSSFSVDADGNGEADLVDVNDKSKGYIKYYCDQGISESGEVASLGVSCDLGVLCNQP